MLTLLALGALALALAIPVRAADDGDGDDVEDRRQEALEALRDLEQADTDEEYETALKRFNDKATDEQEAAREQLMRRLDRDDEGRPEE
jgi:hypothetical protein